MAPDGPSLRWSFRRRGEYRPPAQLSVEADNIVGQLIGNHRDGDWPTAIGWYLPIETPPWDALKELRRSGTCTVRRDGKEVAVDFTHAGRRAYVVGATGS